MCAYTLSSSPHARSQAHQLRTQAGAWLHPINMTTLSPFFSALFSVLAMAKLMRLRAISTLRGFMGAGRSHDGTSFPDIACAGLSRDT